MKREGFSLIEVLVVLAVLSVVTTIGTGAFVQMTSAWRQTALRNSLNEEGIRAFDAIRRDISELMSPALSGTAPVIVTGMETRQRYQRVALESDELILPIEIQSPDGIVRQSVRYRIDRDGDTPILRRSVGAFDAAPDEFTELGAPVAEGVLSIRVQVFDGAHWRNGFAGIAEPEAIRISLVLQDATRVYEQIARVSEFSLSTS